MTTGLNSFSPPRVIRPFLVPWLLLLLASFTSCDRVEKNILAKTVPTLQADATLPASPTSFPNNLPAASQNPSSSRIVPQSQPFVEVKRLSDFPLYEAHLHGDYGFQQHIQHSPAPASALPRNVQTFACSTFAALGDPHQRILGRNFDWYEHPALILFTHPPGGYASVSMVDLHYLGYNQQVTPLSYTQPLQRAPYFPFDGMNEQGLAVGMMAVPHADGQHHPGAVTLDELELMRLILDYAQDVPSALRLIHAYNVSFGSVPIHYLLADASGSSAVLEYLDGDINIFLNEKPWQTATNFLISQENPVGAASSCWRYNKMYATLEKAGGVHDPISAMDLLQSVSQPGTTPTRWSIVYDLSHQLVRLAVGRDYTTIFRFSLDQ